ANALNALSKWPDTPDCVAAASALASRLANDRNLLNALNPKGVANTLNALSKWQHWPRDWPMIATCSTPSTRKAWPTRSTP
ncbi:hypothetical protein, partial [Pseudomonas syringae]|uniref:hypothetical protein n=1 Tax=Pseudomonas syringae TaxID=317 RepID=UPI00211E6935